MSKLRYLVEFKVVDRIPLATFNSWSDAEAFVVHRCKGVACSEKLYPITDQFTGAVEFIHPILLGNVHNLSEKRQPES
jgi:hypothetical protein